MNDDALALANKTRKLIYNFILAQPGTSFGAIKKIFEMKDSTLKYHLNYLEKVQLVISKREGRLRCYYCKYKAVPWPTFLLTDIDKLTEKQKLILNVIKNNPGITKKELMFKSKSSKKDLRKIIRKLGNLKLIWITNNDGKIGYEYISKEKLRDEIMKRLIKKLFDEEIDEETYFKIKKKIEMLNINDV